MEFKQIAYSSKSENLVLMYNQSKLEVNENTLEMVKDEKTDQTIVKDEHTSYLFECKEPTEGAEYTLK